MGKAPSNPGSNLPVHRRRVDHGDEKDSCESREENPKESC